MTSIVLNEDEENDSDSSNLMLNAPPNLLRRTFWYTQKRYWKQGLAAVVIYTAVMIVWTIAVR